MYKITLIYFILLSLYQLFGADTVVWDVSFYSLHYAYVGSICVYSALTVRKNRYIMLGFSICALWLIGTQVTMLISEYAANDGLPSYNLSLILILLFILIFVKWVKN